MTDFSHVKAEKGTTLGWPKVFVHHKGRYRRGLLYGNGSQFFRRDGCHFVGFAIDNDVRVKLMFAGIRLTCAWVPFEDVCGIIEGGCGECGGDTPDDDYLCPTCRSRKEVS